MVLVVSIRRICGFSVALIILHRSLMGRKCATTHGVSPKVLHIFPNAQVASNKNAHKLWYHFWAQFFMLFHMMWSILFRVLALKTLKWKYLIGCWRTSTNKKVVSQPNTPNKINHTMWKSMKNCALKWCCKLCAFLFKVTCSLWKMWKLKEKTQLL